MKAKNLNIILQMFQQEDKDESTFIAPSNKAEINQTDLLAREEHSTSGASKIQTHESYAEISQDVLPTQTPAKKRGRPPKKRLENKTDDHHNSDHE